MAHWESASEGQVPDGAVYGGQDHNSPIVVARAWHENDLIPGKLVLDHKTCYVAWNGLEYSKPQYEVMCGARVEWEVMTQGEQLPLLAYPAGVSETGDVLYVGRKWMHGTLQVGKVRYSDGKCCISYGGREKKFSNYEILVLIEC